LQESAEAGAEKIIGGELKRKGWIEDDLRVRRKGDVFKVRLAQGQRVETTMTLKWIAERLRMGTRGHPTHLRGRKKPLKKPSSVTKYVKTID